MSHSLGSMAEKFLLYGDVSVWKMTIIPMYTVYQTGKCKVWRAHNSQIFSQVHYIPWGSMFNT